MRLTTEKSKKQKIRQAKARRIILLVLFVECVFSEGFYIALGEVFYDNRGFLLVQYSVEAALEQILIVEIELVAHSWKSRS